VEGRRAMKRRRARARSRGPLFGVADWTTLLGALVDEVRRTPLSHFLSLILYDALVSK
jgi:hypothetical protein